MIPTMNDPAMSRIESDKLWKGKEETTLWHIWG